MTRHPFRQFRESAGGTSADLELLLAEEIVFSSPIFSRALTGRDLVVQVMMASGKVRNGHFTHEFKDGPETVLIWEGEIDGHKLVSFELLRVNHAGKIIFRSVAFKPLPVAELFRDVMYKQFKDLIPADMWVL